MRDWYSHFFFSSVGNQYDHLMSSLLLAFLLVLPLPESFHPLRNCILLTVSSLYWKISENPARIKKHSQRETYIRDTHGIAEQIRSEVWRSRFKPVTIGQNISQLVGTTWTWSGQNVMTNYIDNKALYTTSYRVWIPFDSRPVQSSYSSQEPSFELL